MRIEGLRGQEGRRGFFEKITTSYNKLFRSFLLGLLLVFSGHPEAKTLPSETPRQTTVTEISVPTYRFLQKREKIGNWDQFVRWLRNLMQGKAELNVLHRLWRVENGELKFNPTFLIAPFDIEIATNINGLQERINVEILYQYARLFDLAKALNPDDRKKTEKLIEEELSKRITNELVLAISKAAYEASKLDAGVKILSLGDLEELKNLQVRGVYVVGYASPEGPAWKGPNTINEIDQENIELAKLRAEDMIPAIQKALGRVFANEREINEFIEINGEELQFSAEELSKLYELANKLGYKGDRLQKIFEMIVDYNDGKIQEEEAKKTLDEIIASKRKVVLMVDYEGDRRAVLLIPIPLLLPLWIKIINTVLNRKRRKKDGKLLPKEGPRLPDPESLRKEIPPEFNKLYEEIRRSPGHPQYNPEYMRFRVIVADLGYFWNDERTIKRGLSYEQITAWCDRYYSSFAGNKEELLELLTYLILRKWEEHDRKFFTEEAGVEKMPDINHVSNEHQIRWALAHASVILEIVEIKEGGGRKLSYEEILSELEDEEINDMLTSTTESIPVSS